MNFQKYVNEKEYPSQKSKDDFMSFRLTEMYDVPMTRREYDYAVGNLVNEASDYMQRLRAEYQDREAEIQVQFRADAEVEHGFAHLPVELKSRLHGIAYEEGHAHGYEEIFNQYYDLVELVLLAYNLGKDGE